MEDCAGAGPEKGNALDSGLPEYPLLDMDDLDRKVVLFVLGRDAVLRRRYCETDSIFSEREWMEFIRDRGECREVLELECALSGTSLDERCRVLENGLRKIVEWHEKMRERKTDFVL